MRRLLREDSADLMSTSMKVHDSLTPEEKALYSYQVILDGGSPGSALTSRTPPILLLAALMVILIFEALPRIWPSAPSMMLWLSLSDWISVSSAVTPRYIFSPLLVHFFL